MSITKKEIDKMSAKELLELDKAIQLAKKAEKISEALKGIRFSLFTNSLPEDDQVIFVEAESKSKVYIRTNGCYRFAYRAETEGYFHVLFLSPEVDDVYEFLKRHDKKNTAVEKLWLEFLSYFKLDSTLSL